jgi:hypothetical protein
MTDLAKRIAALSPEKRQLLLQHLQQNKKDNFAQNDITPQNRDTNTFPLSFAQQRLWFIDQLEPGNIALNLSLSIGLKGSLNVKALEASFQELVNRHEVLRTTFTTLQGQPVQVISPNLSLELAVVDLQALPANERESKMLQLATAEAHQPFDLTKDTLLRVTLLQLAKSEYALLLTMHHIISDGWSVGVLVREIAALYEAYSSGKLSALPQLPIQYVDFAVWQRKWLQGGKLETQLAYWQQQLGGELPVLQLPTDFPRPAIQTFRGKRQQLVLPKSLSEQLKTWNQQEGITLFMVLLAALQTLLYWYTGQEDIVIGTDIANRNQAETKDLIGFFINQLVLRINLSGNSSFEDLLRQVREVALGAYTHQDLPFDKLVNTLNPLRNMAHAPLFQVKLVLENTQIPSLQLKGVNATPLRIEKKTTQLDLLWEVVETEQGIVVVLEYNTDLFLDQTATRMLKNFEILLNQIVVKPRAKLAELIEILALTDKKQQIREIQQHKEEFKHKLKQAQRRVVNSTETVEIVE